MDDISFLSQLETLNLEDNQIRKIEGLEGQQRLETLYLNRNRVHKLAGLQFCCSLRVLQMNNQKLLSGEYFELDMDSLAGVSECLQELELTEVKLKGQVQSFGYLRYLQVLRLGHNLIEGTDGLETALMGMQSLRVLILKGNPIETQLPKFRDMVLMHSQSVEELDDKPVLLHERQFLQEFYKRKGGKVPK